MYITGLLPFWTDVSTALNFKRKYQQSLFQINRSGRISYFKSINQSKKLDIATLQVIYAEALPAQPRLKRVVFRVFYIKASMVQGSGIGPTNFITVISSLKPVHPS